MGVETRFVFYQAMAFSLKKTTQKTGADLGGRPPSNFVAQVFLAKASPSARCRQNLT